MKKKIEEVNAAEKEMDWDSGISAEATATEYEIPPVGEYGFTVIEFEKTVSKSGKKMAKINIQLDEAGRKTRIYDYLVLQESMAWKLASFFESLNLKQKGEPLTTMPWDKVLYTEGRVKIKHEIYEGEERCKVDRYLPCAAATAPAKPDIDVPFEV